MSYTIIDFSSANLSLPANTDEYFTIKPRVCYIHNFFLFYKALQVTNFTVTTVNLLLDLCTWTSASALPIWVKNETNYYLKNSEIITRRSCINEDKRKKKRYKFWKVGSLKKESIDLSLWGCELHTWAFFAVPLETWVRCFPQQNSIFPR